jgi:hypothetical protein
MGANYLLYNETMNANYSRNQDAQVIDVKDTDLQRAEGEIKRET